MLRSKVRSATHVLTTNRYFCRLRAAFHADLDSNWRVSPIDCRPFEPWRRYQADRMETRVSVRERHLLGCPSLTDVNHLVQQDLDVRWSGDQKGGEPKPLQSVRSEHHFARH